MPFKTKRRKIRTEKKRVEISQGGLAIYRSSESRETADTTLQSPTFKKPQLNVQSHSYVTPELIKIMAIAFVIIGLQIILKLSNITF